MPPNTILTLQNAQLAFGHVPLLLNAQATLLEAERIGLIGRNGTGKSSLLKVIAGLQVLDDGRCTQQAGLRVQYVPQEPAFDDSATVQDAVASAFEKEAMLLKAYEQAAAAHAKDAQASAQLAQLQEQIDTAGVWQIRNRVDEMIKRFGLDAHARVQGLSGGQKKRVALAKALVYQPDLLLLDEPTNHLDLSAIEWLESLLLQYKGSSIFITHDRQFLDRVATRILELDRGVIRSYPGNYAAYQRRKQDELHAETLENQRFDKLLAQEEVWIRKGVEARRTRNEGRVLRLMAMRKTRAERLERTGSLQMEAAAAQKSGNLVAELIRVDFGYPGQPPLLRDFSTLITRGDKVGLIGDNGVGKTSLLKLILGELEPTGGSIRRGSRLEVAYFDQMRAALNPEATIAETISPGSDWIEVNGQRKHVMSYLGDFLFSPQRARSPVKSLSGGERNRLLLARLFAKPSNLLVLDEPTNDLDMESLDLLEEVLVDYSGTVLLVSHDRRFLDQVVTQSIGHIAGDRWGNFAGGHAVWSEQVLPMRQAHFDSGQGKSATTKPIANQSGAGARPNESKPATGSHRVQTQQRRQKLSYKDQRRLNELPALIEALEHEQAQISELLQDGSLYASDPAKAQSLSSRHHLIEEQLLALLEEWTNLQP